MERASKMPSSYLCDQ
ncbi:hypothetical protein [Escherichia coli]|nr:hypothetical protein [Escherichia coli]MCN4550791.1 hypothetical protein [Escherichia coli]MCN8627742.1 hypothetical protein [Escherichia coli]MCN9990028.1 hypothetical protein [Escherichia coli]MCO0119509.1 hypothetical protein [Escherichia coli]MCT8915395.1 hypothetical protein [Escherichia coli]